MSERPHPRADELDSLSTLELVELMHAEDRRAIEAVRPCLDTIGLAVDRIAEQLKAGGRLHYFGAGTSGRIAKLDAAECAPTFGIAADMVQAHDAGDGEHEDDGRRGEQDAERSHLTSRDVVVGVSASGRTRYVLGAIETAGAAGATVIAFTCAPGSPLAGAADIAIEVDTGPEVIAGSTRLKAGTVQKVVLNMISTGVFKRLGHTFRGRMVDVVDSNMKLHGRAVRMVAELGGAPEQAAAHALAEARGSVKVAIVMVRGGLAAGDARKRLDAAGGDLSSVLAEVVRQ